MHCLCTFYWSLFVVYLVAGLEWAARCGHRAQSISPKASRHSKFTLDFHVCMLVHVAGHDVEFGPCCEIRGVIITRYFEIWGWYCWDEAGMFVAVEYSQLTFLVGCHTCLWSLSYREQIGRLASPNGDMNFFHSEQRVGGGRHPPAPSRTITTAGCCLGSRSLSRVMDICTHMPELSCIQI